MTHEKDGSRGVSDAVTANKKEKKQITRKGFRQAVREFNHFMRDAPPIGSEPDPVGPNERVYKRLICDRKNRTYREERVQDG